jgi:hypothetical protein
MTGTLAFAWALLTPLHPDRAAGVIRATGILGAAWTPSDLLDDPGFRQGIHAGIVALVVVLVAAVLVRRPSRWRDFVLPVAGIAIAVATLVALERTGGRVLLSHRLEVGIVLLLVGPCAVALVLARWHGAWWVAAAGALAAVPGAVEVGRAAALQSHVPGMRTLVVVSTVIGGLLVADFDDANGRAGLGPVLVVIAVLGMYGTLPDTEQTALLVGVVVPLAFVGWPVAMARLGPGAYATVGMLGWVAAVGGRGRPGSGVGAIACLGVMLGEPVARRLWRGAARVPRSPWAWRAVALVLLQLGVVWVASRIAGFQTSTTTAGWQSLIALGVAVAGSAIVLAPRTRGEPPKTSAKRQSPGPFTS